MYFGNFWLNIMIFRYNKICYQNFIIRQKNIFNFNYNK